MLVLWKPVWSLQTRREAIAHNDARKWMLALKPPNQGCQEYGYFISFKSKQFWFKVIILCILGEPPAPNSDTSEASWWCGKWTQLWGLWCLMAWLGTSLLFLSMVHEGHFHIMETGVTECPYFIDEGCESHEVKEVAVVKGVEQSCSNH